MPVIVTLLSLGACQKQQDEAPLEQVSLALPASVELRYGQETDLALPAALRTQSETQFALEFDETENVQTSGQTRLREQLAAAVTVDRDAGHIHIRSAALYPNGAVSSISQAKIPTQYKVTVVARTSRGEVGRQTVALTITPAAMQISGVDNAQPIPLAYVLYSDQATSFELTASDEDLRATKWFLPGPLDPAISLSGNKIQFSAQAGDPKKAEERTYNLAPALQKDGFTIASTNFRVTLVPQIRFLYGVYSVVDWSFRRLSLENGFRSEPATLIPENYKSTFKLVSIAKDGKAYTDTNGLFSVEEQTGRVSFRPHPDLKAGQYVLSVKAITTIGLEFSTTFTLALE